MAFRRKDCRALLLGMKAVTSRVASRVCVKLVLWTRAANSVWFFRATVLERNSGWVKNL